jgi:DNA mismatch endonuclease (patch repair protein)
LAVFIDGCFWHGCPSHYGEPKSNAEFWRAKIATNCDRDRLVDQKLNELGWHVARFWEHELREDLPAAVARVMNIVSPQHSKVV